MATAASPVKTILMSVVAIIAIVIAIAVAIKTFGGPQVRAVIPPTEPITGVWEHVTDGPVDPSAPPPPDFIIAQRLASFDAGDGKTATLRLTNGETLVGRVVNSTAGSMEVEVQPKKGPKVLVKISQIGRGEPVIITDPFGASELRPKR